MRIYEELFIVRPDAPEEEIDQLIEQLTTLIAAQGGNVDKSDKWGVRKLAYRVQKRSEGFYVLLQFTAKPETVKELERRLRVSDLVMKFLTVRIDEKLKKIEKRKKEREKRAARKPAPPARPPALPSVEHAMAGAAEPAVPGRALPCPARRAGTPVGEGIGEHHGGTTRRTSHQRIAAAHRRRQGDGHQEAIFPAQESVPVLRRKDRRHQLQGREDALVLHLRARQDRAPAHLRRVHAAPAAAGAKPSNRRATSR